MQRPTTQRPAPRSHPNHGFDRISPDARTDPRGSPGDVRLLAGSDSSVSQRGASTGRGRRGYARSDERLRQDIRERLTQDPDLDAGEIEVSVDSGHVLLRGTLRQRWQKHHAENLAVRCSGVRDVENPIRVHKRDATGDASAATVSLHGAHGKAVGGAR